MFLYTPRFCEKTLIASGFLQLIVPDRPWTLLDFKLLAELHGTLVSSDVGMFWISP